MKILLLIFLAMGFSLPALAKGEYRKFKKLNFRQQVLYMKTLRQAVVTIETAYPEITGQLKKRKRKKRKSAALEWSFFSRLYAADEDPLRCMYGGFVIRGKNCRNKSTVSYETSAEPPITQTFNCKGKSGTVLCNPLIFGSNEGEGICVKKQKWATQACHEAAGENYESVVAFVNTVPGAFSKYLEDFNALCRDPGPENVGALKNRPTAIKDVTETCQVALERLKKILNDPKIDEDLKSKLEIKPDLKTCEYNRIDAFVFCSTNSEKVDEENEVAVGNFFENCFQTKCNRKRDELDKIGCFSKLEIIQKTPDIDIVDPDRVQRAKFSASAKCSFVSQNCFTGEENCKTEKVRLDDGNQGWACLIPEGSTSKKGDDDAAR